MVEPASASAREEWEGRWRRGETGWDRGGPNPALMRWLEDGALEPCRVLIPGCGRGYEAVELARRGFEVTAIDIAPSAVHALKRALEDEGLAARVILGDLFEFEPDAPFDAVYEQTCLCAIEPGQRAAYERRLQEWLRPEGRLLALFMQTGRACGPPFHCDLLDMRRLFADSRWRWPEGAMPLFSPHRNGRFELGYVLRRL